MSYPDYGHKIGDRVAVVVDWGGNDPGEFPTLTDNGWETGLCVGEKVFWVKLPDKTRLGEGTVLLLEARHYCKLYKGALLWEIVTDEEDT